MFYHNLINLARKRQETRFKRVFKRILDIKFWPFSGNLPDRKNTGTMPEKVSIPDLSKRDSSGKMEELFQYRHPARALSEKNSLQKTAP